MYKKASFITFIAICSLFLLLVSTSPSYSNSDENPLDSINADLVFPISMFSSYGTYFNNSQSRYQNVRNSLYRNIKSALEKFGRISLEEFASLTPHERIASLVNLYNAVAILYHLRRSLPTLVFDDSLTSAEHYEFFFNYVFFTARYDKLENLGNISLNDIAFAILLGNENYISEQKVDEETKLKWRSFNALVEWDTPGRVDTEILFLLTFGCPALPLLKDLDIDRPITAEDIADKEKLRKKIGEYLKKKDRGAKIIGKTQFQEMFKDRYALYHHYILGEFNEVLHPEEVVLPYIFNIYHEAFVETHGSIYNALAYFWPNYTESVVLENYEKDYRKKLPVSFRTDLKLLVPWE